MTHRLTTNYAKNYCNRALIVKVIVENVVTCFLGTRCIYGLSQILLSIQEAARPILSTLYISQLTDKDVCSLPVISHLWLLLLLRRDYDVQQQMTSSSSSAHFVSPMPRNSALVRTHACFRMTE